MNESTDVGQDDVFAMLLREVAEEDAPRRLAVVEECGEGELRAAGYGLAFADRVEVDSVEGGFRLSSESAESARVLFEISSRSAGVRQVHLVWLDDATSRQG
ncbi:hypothetical protein B0I31_104390 [Saccharothrix carnea]|uniref:Uncharacterized protein n=1 Tax=Saccharothrix carnea TaxID=1280637 RepID=A0A2P8ICB1_SACCR|nr:hypothetical protein [Saccharothrix carnea]PSL56099.1 hypothetical protein B0I31_104390 [Saccharothrix carnea]